MLFNFSWSFINSFGAQNTSYILLWQFKGISLYVDSNSTEWYNACNP